MSDVKVWVPQETGDIILTSEDVTTTYAVDAHIVVVGDEDEARRLLLIIDGSREPSSGEAGAKTRKARTSKASPAEPPAETAGGEPNPTPGTPADPEQE